MKPDDVFFIIVISIAALILFESATHIFRRLIFYIRMKTMSEEKKKLFLDKRCKKGKHLWKQFSDDAHHRTLSTVSWGKYECDNCGAEGEERQFASSMSDPYFVITKDGKFNE